MAQAPKIRDLEETIKHRLPAENKKLIKCGQGSKINSYCCSSFNMWDKIKMYF